MRREVEVILLHLLGNLSVELRHQSHGEADESEVEVAAEPAVRECYLGPPVVHDAVGHRVVVGGDDFVRVLFGRPAHVVPQHVRVVPVDELTPVRSGVAGVFFAQRALFEEVCEPANRLIGECPVGAARVVEAQLEATGTHRGAEVAHEVAAGSVVRGHMRVGNVGRPERVTVEMAGDHDYISGTDVDEQICPVLEVHLRGVGRELLPEIEVGEVLAVGLGVMFAARASRR